jgi:hypothetical protein
MRLPRFLPPAIYDEKCQREQEDAEADADPDPGLGASAETAAR